MEVTGEQVLRKIEADDRYATTMLIKLYERQTEDEQEAGETVHRNNVGFNALDSDFLSSLAQQAINRRAQRKAGEIPAHWTDLSPKQMACLRKKLPKYVRQMVDITNAKFAEKANDGPLTGVAAAEELVTRMAANGASIAECFAVAAAVLGKSEDLPSPAIVEQINEPAERPYVEPSCRLIDDGNGNLRFPTDKEIRNSYRSTLAAEAQRKLEASAAEFDRIFG